MVRNRVRVKEIGEIGVIINSSHSFLINYVFFRDLRRLIGFGLAAAETSRDAHFCPFKGLTTSLEMGAYREAPLNFS